jgi:hypothetical protein
MVILPMKAVAENTALYLQWFVYAWAGIFVRSGDAGARIRVTPAEG